MADHNHCKHYENCDYRNDVGSCPNSCVQYKHKDAVIVVRCKDCKFWAEGRHHCGRCNALVNFHNAELYMTESGHFCSYGEKNANADPEGEIDFDYSAED